MSKFIKLVVVLDCEILDPDWTEETIRENVPDYVGTLCGLHPAAMDGEAMTAYVLYDPTVYTSLNDFDADRAAHLDHFKEDPR